MDINIRSWFWHTLRFDIHLLLQGILLCVLLGFLLTFQLSFSFCVCTNLLCVERGNGRFYIMKVSSLVWNIFGAVIASSYVIIALEATKLSALFWGGSILKLAVVLKDFIFIIESSKFLVDFRRIAVLLEMQIFDVI